MKNGIILAGGNGTRLYPLTHVVNKHLLGVDGKFILDYPIQTLKQMGVENLTVVLGGSHFSQVVDHLKDGQAFGMNVNYVYQGEAKGIAQAINLCKRFVDWPNDQFAVVLGDNIFEKPVSFFYDKEKEYGDDYKWKTCASVVLHRHPDLKRFGVATLNQAQQIIKIEEKPQVLDINNDNYAITGCYMFDSQFFRFFQDLRPSARGEYEITDILQAYHREGKLTFSFTEGLWSDAGTHESIAYLNDYYFRNKL
jgi:glucose-1-phosphate thymidylyltransferase